MSRAATPRAGHNAERDRQESLRNYVQRLETLDEEIGGLNREKSDVFSEAKTHGFAPHAVRSALKYRRDPSAYTEKSAEVDEVLRLLGEGAATRTGAPAEPAAEELDAADLRAHARAQAHVHAHEDPGPDGGTDGG